ncbi:MAG: NAD(P)H-dependent glycerol-3-phosphate dehydrogenase [Rhodospirillales bacterium]
MHASNLQTIGIIGAGAWGTALAATTARAGRAVTLWAREPEVTESINRKHENAVFLPGIPLPDEVVATSDLARTCQADAILVVTPAQFVRASTTAMAAHLAKTTPAVICAKGIEQSTLMLMSEVVEETLPGHTIAALSGPTFAAEVARGLPTAVTLACADERLGNELVNALGTETFRAYRSDDVTGAEIGGAVKNVLAIACGIAEGRGLGDNARAALITRGLAEIVRLGRAKGARAETLMGLCGLGDLTLTCNAMQSRNFSLGHALGGGQTLEDIMAARKTIAEGVFSAEAVVALAAKLGVETPICAAVDSILNHGASIDGAIRDLLQRPVGDEAG